MFINSEWGVLLLIDSTLILNKQEKLNYSPKIDLYAQEYSLKVTSSLYLNFIPYLFIQLYSFNY